MEKNTDTREQLNILGVNVDPVDISQALKIIDGFIKERSPRLVVTLGTEMTMMAQKDEELKDVINKAHLVVPDTAGIIWSAKLLYSRVLDKVAGIDLFQKLAEKGVEKNYSFYFLGSKEDTAEIAAKKLNECYPGLKILGTHHGYFRDKEDEVIKEIKKVKPDILILALGVPFQEKWGYKNLENLGVPVTIGVGGSFDVISGKLKRAPQWMIKLSLEWLYRLWKEPSRFIRMLALPHFVIMVFKKKFLG